MLRTLAPFLFAMAGAVLAAGASAQSAAPAVTLDQAVRQVQAETEGRVLSAEPRSRGRHTEYRVKVLTPTGHVRVIVVSSEARRGPAATRSGKHPPGGRAGNKE